MKINYYKMLLWALGSLFLFASELQSKTTEEDSNIDYIDWNSGELEIDQIFVNQQYGNLRLIQSNSNQIKVRSVIQRLDKSYKKAKLITDVKQGHLKIDFDLGDDIELNSANPKQNLRIDTVVFLPKNTKLKAKVEKGKLLTKAISNDLSIESFNSDFDVNSTGTLDLYSQNGNIHVKISSDRDALTEIKTSKGTITLFYEISVVNFIIKTFGHIASNDWELMKTKAGKEPNYEMSLGKEGRPIYLSSDSGNILLLKKQ